MEKSDTLRRVSEEVIERIGLLNRECKDCKKHDESKELKILNDMYASIRKLYTFYESKKEKA